jgi:hypothetical protein
MSDCVGCGYCCIKAQCNISRVMLGDHKRCPALKWNGKRYLCELAKDKKIADSLAIGAGCSSSLFNIWRRDIREHDRSEIE